MIKEYKKYRDDTVVITDEYNDNYIKTYKFLLEDNFKSPILDLGCGDGSLVNALRVKGYKAQGLDINDMDFEKDKLPKFKANVIIMNAVIEHIKDPTNILKECFKALNKGGHIIIRTPNFKIDYLNFYDDPTHVKPYTPTGLCRLMESFGFNRVLLEPGVIMNNKLQVLLSTIYSLPDVMKWDVASELVGGSKSILFIGRK